MGYKRIHTNSKTASRKSQILFRSEYVLLWFDCQTPQLYFPVKSLVSHVLNQRTNTLQLTDMWIKSTILLQICNSERDNTFPLILLQQTLCFVKISVMRTINGYCNKKTCLCQCVCVCFVTYPHNDLCDFVCVCFCERVCSCVGTHRCPVCVCCLFVFVWHSWLHYG